MQVRKYSNHSKHLCIEERHLSRGTAYPKIAHAPSEDSDQRSSHYVWNGVRCNKISYILVNESRRQKTYLRTCAPSEDSDQRSLIRIFTGHIFDGHTLRPK